MAPFSSYLFRRRKGRGSPQSPDLELRGCRLWTAAAAIVIVAGIVASLVVARLDASGSSTKARLAFRSSAGGVASALRLAIQHEQDLVVSGAAYMAANPRSSQAEFEGWTRSVEALSRYPELQGLGFVVIVPAARLKAFEAASSAASGLPYAVVPPGTRPFYCLGTVGIARRALGGAAGLDYCAADSNTLATRDTGRGSYYPVAVANGVWLGVSTPVYSKGAVPATLAGRRAAFVGWLGEALDPSVVLARALEGHPGEAVSLRYPHAGSDVVFGSGKQAPDAAAVRFDLGNGWVVKVFGPHISTGLAGDVSALTYLLGGSALAILLGLLLYVLATGRVRALELVNEKTRQLGYQALHDKLTGLPNRALVLDRAENLLARNRREPDRVVAALFIDIDGFKRVNDTYGHAAGDEVLRAIGQRLRDLLREQDTVGRLGGDEFVVLLESSAPEASPAATATRVLDDLSRPIPLDDAGVDRSIIVSASIGVAVGQRDTADDLLRDADFALYEAKALGKARYSVFEQRMQTEATDRLALEADLEDALEHGQFFLLYQPTFDLQTQEVLTIEALIRWHHPVRGVLLPEEFIPVAEETGMVSPIGRWVLREACAQLAHWQEQGHRIGISVNISAYQLDRDGLAADVALALEESGIDPATLTLEITETALMHDVAAAAHRLGELKALGVRLAIDDFGTGYSSLAYLRQFPVDALKIDRSFISNVATSSESAAIIHTLVQLGKTLRIDTLAEGIEDTDQLRELQREQCDHGQGFLFARPLDSAAVEAFLRSQPSRAAAEPKRGLPGVARPLRLQSS